MKAKQSLVGLTFKADLGDPKQMELARKFNDELHELRVAYCAEKSDEVKDTPMENAEEQVKEEIIEQSGPTKKDKKKKDKKAKKDKKKKDKKAKEEVSHDITKDELLALIKQKSKKHKDTLKSKLRELDATSIVDLEAEHYPEFKEFLEGLDG